MQVLTLLEQSNCVLIWTNKEKRSMSLVCALEYLFPELCSVDFTRFSKGKTK